uniref:Gustatory receptor n=1 Tax=Drosophila rhopaloa TaxID=1041015 RepID=A0A6P4ER12_DRORH
MGLLVMTRIRRCLNASRICGLLLWSCFTYGVVMVVITFRIERKDSNLVARNRRAFRWICIGFRLLASCVSSFSYVTWVGQFTNSYLRAFFILRLLGFLICSAIILVLQFWFSEELLQLVNRFLELFRRLRILTNSQTNGFGGSHELTLMSMKLISLFFAFLAFHFKFSPMALLTMLCDFYTSVGTGMIMHLCFIGYLSIGVLYKDLNNYVDCQLRAQLTSLNEGDVGDNPQPSLEAISNLDKCLSLYEDIHQVSRRFQRLFDLPLFITLAQSLSGMAMILYFSILQRKYIFKLWGLVIKLLIDVILLTMSVHSAVSGSRLVKRLSLENFYVTESTKHHQKLELFLGRLHRQELRVCPLGLFEVSNELTLYFLSAMVTYLTFLVQCRMQLPQI